MQSDDILAILKLVLVSPKDARDWRFKASAAFGVSLGRRRSFGTYCVV